jgi:hypothetical protein
MMPPFPRPSLSFRTAGDDWKAGMNAAIAILDIGWMNDGVQQEA